MSDPRWHCELLLGHLLALGRHELYLHPETEVPPGAVAAFAEAVTRRATGEPTQYIMGETEFYGLKFTCDRRALIPRPETEHLLAKVVQIAGSLARQQVTLLDLGTGSGCIAVCAAVHLEAAQVWASDVATAALELARLNSKRHGVETRIEFRHSDLFAQIPETFDLIAANLPYVASGDRALLQREVRDWEPAGALFAGTDGLEFLEPVIRQAPDHLESGGHLVLEIGATQLAAVKGLIESTGCFAEVAWLADYQGHPRVVAARKM